MRIVLDCLGVTIKGKRSKIKKLAHELSVIEKYFLNITENTLAIVTSFSFELECAAFDLKAYDSKDMGDPFTMLLIDENDLVNVLGALSSALLKE